MWTSNHYVVPETNVTLYANCNLKLIIIIKKTTWQKGFFSWGKISLNLKFFWNAEVAQFFGGNAILLENKQKNIKCIMIIVKKKRQQVYLL